MVCAECGARNSHQSQFCGSCGASLSAKHLMKSRAAIEGERKQVTVLFADMKESTSLIQDLDPEQVEERLRPTLQVMIDAVHRYEGTINRIEGDGIMALFGAPLAYEDGAVRAAYAALDMQNALRAASDTQPAIRVGLHSGEVLVRAVNTDLSVDYDAIGTTVHLAARMEQMAAPGSIYCTASVVRLATGLIDVRPLGLVPVKGFREPLELFEITGHTSARTRWEVTAARGLTGFISRDTELAVLRDAMRDASRGCGRLVGVVGEPGTGKSRLVHEALHLPEAEAWTVLKTATASYLRNTPYLAFSNLIRTWFEIPEQAGPADIDHRIRANLSALGKDLLPTLPAIQSLLDMPIDDAEWQSLEPPARRQRILTATKNLILRAAGIRPLLLWFEDMQWTDAETRALLDGIANDIGNSALMIVLTYRPEYRHAWAGKDAFRFIQIEALDQQAAEQLVRAMLGDDPANAELRELVVQRTEGIPLFIEETVRSLVESGVLRGRTGNYTPSRELHDIRLPDSVQAVLASRIDRLAPAQRGLLQTASVIGTDVQVTLLERISGVNARDLRALLADLQASGFLYQIPNTASFQFRFKHALAHEVAYGSLLSKTRQDLHGRIVRAIESQYRGNLTEVVESLAHHALNGGLWNELLIYARQAGGKAVDVSAYREARIFYEQALLALTHLPQDRAHIETGIDIRLGLRGILGATTEYSALEICLREAETMAMSIADRPRLAAISVAQTFVHNWQGDLESGIRCGERGLDIARDIGDRRLELSASSFLGQAYMWRGNFKRSLTLLRDDRAWTTGPLRLERIGTTGTSSVLWLGMLAASQAYLGDFPDAQATAQQACAIADEIQRPYDTALAHWYEGFVFAHRGDAGRALTALERAYHICRSAQISFLVPVISTSLGHACALAGRPKEGIEFLTRAAAFSQSAKFPYGVAWSTVYLGFANLAAGRTQDVIAQADAAIELASRHGYRAVEASARRLMGEACQHSRRHDDAATHYLAARRIALELGLRPELAHCESGLAQTCFLLGRTDDGNNHLVEATSLYSRLDMPIPPTAPVAIGAIAQQAGTGSAL